MSALLLAAASLDVTPPPGHRLDGYAARTQPAIGTADPLRATLIWLSSVDSPGVLWLSLDAVAAGTELVAELSAAAASAAGIPPSCVVVCASHTHSGPSGWTGQIHPVIPASREPELYEPLIAAVAAAPLTRSPVRAFWRSTPVTGVGTNRHRRDGPHDNTAGVLSLHSLDGSLAALLLDFACHPTTYGPDNLLWSADWPGAARRALAGSDNVVVGYLQGAAGDVSPRFTRQGRGAAEVERLGGLLAAQVGDALARPGLELPSVAPTIRRTTARLKVRALPTSVEAAAIVAAAEGGLGGGLDNPAARIAQTRLDGARGQALMAAAALPSKLELQLSAITLGDVAWLNLPVELFALHGRRLQVASGYPITRVIGYADGYFGYVVDADAVAAGAYEALITYFDQPTTEELLTTAAGLLRTMEQ
ncbi:hypothetical protein [Kribbella monticola]|uniref:hypothetical protein n=1 Tax=Kribbella monticola TaxID=2185285 RepID=UPI000DD4DEA6|nr:hypothetical protein [Kribbella monticola]